MVKDYDSIVFKGNGSCIGSNSQHCFVYKSVTVFRSGLFGKLFGVNVHTLVPTLLVSPNSFS